MVNKSLSNRNLIPLGQRLFDKKIITKSQLDEALHLQSSSHAMLGQILLKKSFVTQDILDKEMMFDIEIEDILVRLGVKTHHIHSALDRQRETGESITDIMQDLGFLSIEASAKALALSKGLDYFPPEEEDNCNFSFINDLNLSLNSFLGYAPVAYDKNKNELSIIITSTNNINVVSNGYRDYKTKLLIASSRTASSIYRKFFSKSDILFEDALAVYKRASNSNLVLDNPDILANVVSSILRHAAYIGASDIHLHCTTVVGLIKLTVDGVSKIHKSISKDLFDKIINKFLTVTNVKREEVLKEMKEGQADASSFFKAGDDLSSRYGFRLEFGNSVNGLTCVIRLLDKQSSASDFNRLGFNEHTMKLAKKYINSSHGLFLITGPTGSGKTTTLYAMLKEIDPEQISIQSIENPAEYKHGLWMQYQVNANESGKEGKASASFLKGLLRNAPKVILMGETRDGETARVVFDASNTGHLVFSTLHTNDAPSALQRLFKMGVSKEDVAENLLGIFAQRLVRQLCVNCKVPDTRDETREIVSSITENIGTLYKASDSGCPNCRHTGYRGRKMIHEVLDTANDEIREMIETGSSISAIRNKGILPGHSMWECGLKYISQGSISLEELHRVINNAG